MVSPIDVAWDVAKGEPFHPSVAGYMAAGHGGERDQAILEEMRRMEKIYDTMPLHGMAALEFHNKYMELENSLSDDPYALQSMRAARPNAERENRPLSFNNRFGEYDISQQSTDDMPPRTMLSGKRDALRLQMYNAGRGKPVGPTGELDTLAHLSDEPLRAIRTDTQILSDELDRGQEARLPEMGSTVRPEPMLQRSSDSPIDSAWSILKTQADATVPPVFSPEPRFNEYGTDMSHVTRTTDMSGRPLAPFPQFRNTMEMFEAMGRSPFTPQGGLPEGVNRLVHRGTDLPKTRMPVAQVPLRAGDNLDERAIGEYLEALKRERMHRAQQMME